MMDAETLSAEALPGKSLWSVVGPDPDDPSRLLCRCACGTGRSVLAVSIRRGRSLSCGCVGREKLGAMRRTHGMSKLPEYKSWEAMIARCEDPEHHKYHLYGAMGVEVCPAWHDFIVFYREMGPRPSPKHTIDRINGRKGYELGNCRWSDVVEQNNNKRTNRTLTYGGRTMTVAQWAREVGQPAGVIYKRLAAGWSVERALSEPNAHAAWRPSKDRRPGYFHGRLVA